MTLWRIKNGLPSVADGLLVGIGLPATMLFFIKTVDPFLNWFEPRGLVYLGYILLLAFYGLVWTLGCWIFAHNQRALRPEVVGPRIALVVAGISTFSIARSILLAIKFPAILQNQLTLDQAGWVIDFCLMLTLFCLYIVVTHAALLWPRRTFFIFLGTYLCLVAAGLVARVVGLLLR